ncbi:MAG: hypothetical protein GF411_15400 [Candidatus Lokiarchaeota archaeon]|nr:hypothetical protein [Candidatus Lokiarchaeota archaeon]
MMTLRDIIKDSDRPDEVRHIAEYVNAHQDEFIAFVRETFDEGTEESKNLILNLIDYITEQLAISVIEHAIEDSSDQIRIRGLKSAYRIRVESLNNRLAEYIEDQDLPFEVQKWSVHILASTDPRAYGKQLRKMARDTSMDLRIRKEIIYALTNVSDDETIGTFCTLLGDANPEIRQAGAWALSRVSVPASINCLLAAMEDDDEEVRNWSIRALRDMDDAYALQMLVETMLKVEPNEQTRMIRLLVEKRSEIILRAIAELLSSPDVNVRRLAAWAMGVSPYPPAMNALKELIDDEDEQVQTYAKKAIARLGGLDFRGVGLGL